MVSVREVFRGLAVLTAGSDAPDSAGFTPHHYAALSGDLGLIRRADPDVRDAAERIPLHYAAAIRDTAAIRELLPRSHVDAVDAYGRTPLFYLLMTIGWRLLKNRSPSPEDAELIRLFLTRGAGLSYIDARGTSILEAALDIPPSAPRQLIDVIREIVARAPDEALMPRADAEGRIVSPLVTAIRRENDEAARTILQERIRRRLPVDIKVVQEYLWSCEVMKPWRREENEPLMALIAEHLRQGGVNLYEPMTMGFITTLFEELLRRKATPVLRSLTGGRVDPEHAVSILAAAAARRFALGKEEAALLAGSLSGRDATRALLNAPWLHDARVVRMLLDAGADTTAVLKRQPSMSDEVLSLLVARHMERHGSAEPLIDLLFANARRWGIEEFRVVVDALTSLGVDVSELRDRWGRTPLHYAAPYFEYGPHRIEYLLDVVHIDPMVEDERGWTALHYLVEAGVLGDIYSRAEEELAVDVDANLYPYSLHNASSITGSEYFSSVLAVLVRGGATVDEKAVEIAALVEGTWVHRVVDATARRMRVAGAGT